MKCPGIFLLNMTQDLRMSFASVAHLAEERGLCHRALLTLTSLALKGQENQTFCNETSFLCQ